jgi:hypothetical protein
MSFILQACEGSVEMSLRLQPSEVTGCTRLQQRPWKAAAVKQKPEDGETGAEILKTKDLIFIIFKYINEILKLTL